MKISNLKHLGIAATSLLLAFNIGFEPAGQTQATENRASNRIAQRDFADGLSGGPDFWEVIGVEGFANGLAIRQSPKLYSPQIVSGIRNGAVLRNLGCSMQGGERWCQVEPRNNPNQKGWVRGQFLREYSNPTANNSSTLSPGFYEVKGAGRNGIALISSPLTPNAVNATGIMNGTIVRVQLCGNDNWCRVELRDNPRLKGWVRTTNLRSYSASSVPSNTSNSGRPGDPVAALQDLVGARGGQAEDAVKQRGYTWINTKKQADSSFSYWLEQNTAKCVAIRTTDGRYAAIVYTAKKDCNR